MANQPKKISEEPVATSVGENDRFVILYNANTTSPSVRTISANNVMKTMFAGVPVYANNTTALANGESNGTIYATTDGAINIVLGA
jgi:hypothetical protein